MTHTIADDHAIHTTFPQNEPTNTIHNIAHKQIACNFTNKLSD